MPALLNRNQFLRTKGKKWEIRALIDFGDVLGRRMICIPLNSYEIVFETIKSLISHHTSCHCKL